MVELGGFPFTALGHRTETRWVSEEGIPAAEAVWWAGGVRVSERLCALWTNGVYRRAIRLAGAHLLGQESVVLRLALAPGEHRREGALLLQEGRGARTALAVLGNAPSQVSEEKGALEIGPRRSHRRRGASGYFALRSSPLRRPAGLLDFARATVSSAAR